MAVSILTWRCAFSSNNLAREISAISNKVLNSSTVIWLRLRSAARAESSQEAASMAAKAQKPAGGTFFFDFNS